MLRLTFETSAPLRALCLGAHCNDIEIGAGATLLRLIEEKRIAAVDWVVFSSNPARAAEARASAELFLAGVQWKNVQVLSYQDGFFPHAGQQLRTLFESIQKRFEPDIVFTHHKDDLHQDHRVVAELAWQTFRSHVLLEYEVPKYDGNPFNPNLYVPVEEAVMRRKINGILTSFVSQRSKGWFTPDTFLATLRLRGVECASPTRFAEAFVCRKVCV